MSLTPKSGPHKKVLKARRKVVSDGETVVETFKKEAVRKLSPKGVMALRLQTICTPSIILCLDSKHCLISSASLLSALAVMNEVHTG